LTLHLILLVDIPLPRASASRLRHPVILDRLGNADWCKPVFPDGTGVPR
jgi:hypothetical protein